MGFQNSRYRPCGPGRLERHLIVGRQALGEQLELRGFTAEDGVSDKELASGLASVASGDGVLQPSTSPSATL